MSKIIQPGTAHLTWSCEAHDWILYCSDHPAGTIVELLDGDDAYDVCLECVMDDLGSEKITYATIREGYVSSPPPPQIEEDDTQEAELLEPPLVTQRGELP